MKQIALSIEGHIVLYSVHITKDGTTVPRQRYQVLSTNCFIGYLQACLLIVSSLLKWQYTSLN